MSITINALNKVIYCYWFVGVDYFACCMYCDCVMDS